MEQTNFSYWVIIDGTRLGPMEKDAIRNLNIGPNTPIWRSGFADWKTASNVPELADILIEKLPDVPPQTVNCNIATPYYQQPQPYYTLPLQQQQHQIQQPDLRQNQPMPSTYLAWSIITMLICCIPTGIVALIYSCKVSSRWATGDFDGARKASETAAMWIIVSVVLGLIIIPFQILFALI